MRAFVLFALTTLLSSTLMAQTSKTSGSGSYVKDIVMSPSVGLIYTNLRFSDADGVNTTPEAGFSAGLSFDILTRNSYVDYQTGLHYSQTKTSFRSLDENQFVRFESEGEYILRRLSLPVMAKIYPFSKSSRFYTKAGVMLHYMMEAEATFRNRETEFSTSQVSTFENSVKTKGGTDGLENIVVDAVAGIGYGFNLTSSFSLSTELNYQYGVSAIDRTGQMRVDTAFLTIGLGF